MKAKKIKKNIILRSFFSDGTIVIISTSLEKLKGFIGERGIDKTNSIKKLINPET